MGNQIRADLYKLRKTTALTVVLIITMICSVAVAIFAYLIPRGSIAEDYRNIGFFFSDANVISILGAVLASVIICGDFENKTIAGAISSGVSRGSVIVSKAVAFFTGLSLIILPYIVVTGISLFSGSHFSLGDVAVGFTNVFSTSSGGNIGTAVFFKFLAVSVSLLIVYAGQLSLCVLLALIVRKPVLIVTVFYVLTVFLAAMTGIIRKSPVISKIYSFTPYGGNHSFLTLDSSAGDMLKAVLVSLAFIVLMLGITYAIFRKVEIK
jgi:ABC-2 type transport system permease protein